MLNIYSSLCKNYIILIHIFKEYIWVFIDLFTENCMVKGWISRGNGLLS